MILKSVNFSFLFIFFQFKLSAMTQLTAANVM